MLIALPSDEPSLRARRDALAQQLALPIVEVIEAAPPDGVLVVVTAAGLELRDAAEPLHPGIDAQILDADDQPHARDGSRRQPLARAVGVKNTTVVDATGGLGHDTSLLACIGFHVLALERNAVLATMLETRLARGGRSYTGRIEVRHADALTVLADLDPRPDVVYLDPMFPPKRKASALAQKSICLVRALVGDDPDIAQLLEVACRVARDRVVLKRPTHAAPIGPAPTAHVPGKLVRYDIYQVG